MRIAVLGGSGFLGSHLVEALLARGDDVRVFSRTLPGLLPESCVENRNCELFQGSLDNQQLLAQVLDSCDCAVHLISSSLPQSSSLDPIADVHSNLIGTLGFLAVARQVGLPKIVYYSSGGTVYGAAQQTPIPETHPTAPSCAYAITKLAIEHHLALERKLHGLDERVVRLANPYGVRQRLDAQQGAIAVFVGKALANQTISLWGDGEVVRDYVYVTDVTDAVVRLIDYDGPYRLFNIGSGGGTSLNQLLIAIAKLTGRELKIERKPQRKFDLSVNVLDIGRAREQLNWSPSTCLEDGIMRFLNSLAAP